MAGMLTMLGATRPLRRIGTLATVHRAVAVGVAATVRMLAMVLLPAPGSVLSVISVALGLLAMALMLGMIGGRHMLLMRLGSSRRDEGESRRSGKENGLHGVKLLMN